MRLFIYFILFFIAYQVYKATRVAMSGPSIRKRSEESDEITAELVEDPVCHAYCPKNSALRVDSHQKTYYFCSEECKGKFLHTRRGEEK